ncbi:MAG: glycosyltransferase family 9 protein [Ignavibacterium sp.]|nr:glycosyltransferase family 9 protein [Ignavibacterium sp.]
METLINSKRILFIQTAFLGDAILSLPAIESLKKTYSDYKIDVLCIPNTAEVFSSCPFVDEIVVLDKKGKHRSFFKLFNFIKEIRKRNYSRIYSAHRSFRTSIIVLFSEVKETFGFSTASFNYVYNYLVDYTITDHEVKRNLDLVNYPKKIDEWKILPKVIINDQTKSKIKNLIEFHQDRIKIAIAPGSIWFTKKYPANKFKKIVEVLIERGFIIYLIGSKSDFNLCKSIMPENNNVFNFAGEFSVIETVELLKNCNLLISNDSAPTHMAMCADIPVLTIYCSTIPEFGFYPYNKDSDFVSLDGLFCKPCGIHGYKECPLGHFKCANDLNEEIIINKALEILSKVENKE